MMYDENSVMVEIDGYAGTFSCTHSAYHDHQWLYEMTSDNDEDFIIIVDENGDVYEECSFYELNIMCE